MQQIKLIVAYDGTGYLGWQKTSTGRSVEAELEAACERILRHPVCLAAASRTDAGVHARGQVVSLGSEVASLDMRRFLRGVNAVLPGDIRVSDGYFMEDTFHATLDSISKEYHYHLCYGAVPLPDERRTCWHYPYPLDVEAMKEAAALLVGRHDFAALANARDDEPYATTVRTLFRLAIIDLGAERLRFDIEGDHFLYKMVRNLVGTLAYVGRGKLAPSDIPSLLASGDRTRAGVTAPAHGLVLWKVQSRAAAVAQP